MLYNHPLCVCDDGQQWAFAGIWASRFLLLFDKQYVGTLMLRAVILNVKEPGTGTKMTSAWVFFPRCLYSLLLCVSVCVSVSLFQYVTWSVVFQPLGASDYLEMAQLFDTVFIRHVPILTLTLKDQARRFTTLIDNFYNYKVLKNTASNIISLHFRGYFMPLPSTSVTVVYKIVGFLSFDARRRVVRWATDVLW